MNLEEAKAAIAALPAEQQARAVVSVPFQVIATGFGGGRSAKLELQAVAFDTRVTLDMESDIGWFRSQFTGKAKGTLKEIEEFMRRMQDMVEKHS